MEKKPMILAVDDMPINQALLRSQLRFSDYDLITASSGMEALAMIEEQHPDVVLLDIMMPEMDGFETLEKIRENPQTKNLPVFMLTSLSEFEHQAHATMSGATGYLTKPLVTSQLLEVLDELFKN